MAILDWLDMMPFTVQRRTQVGIDRYGKPEYSGDYAYYRARVVYKPRVVTSAITGEDVLANTIVWLGPQTKEPTSQGDGSQLFGDVIFGADGQPILATDISATDEITLPDGTVPQILNWEVQSDETGIHHVKLFVNRGV